MKDLVSRSEVLRILRRKLYCGYRDIDGDWVEGTIDKDAIEEIGNLPSEQSWEWISVKDELPKEKGEYLVSYHPCFHDTIYPGSNVGFDSFRGKTTWAKNKYQKVTAWCERPEPYIEENDEEERRS